MFDLKNWGLHQAEEMNINEALIRQAIKKHVASRACVRLDQLKVPPNGRSNYKED